MAQVKGTSGKPRPPKEIDAVNAQFMQAWSAGNADGIATLFTSDGVLMPPNAGSVRGHTGISDFFNSLMSSGTSTLKLETVEFESHGKSGHEIGKYTVTDENGQNVDNGKYIAILKNNNGKWQISRFIYNSDLPPSY